MIRHVGNGLVGNHWYLRGMGGCYVHLLSLHVVTSLISHVRSITLGYICNILQIKSLLYTASIVHCYDVMPL